MYAVLSILLLATPAPSAAFDDISSAPLARTEPSQDVARQAATAAVVYCEGLGYRTMATVVDADGRPVVAMAAGADVTAALAPDSVRSARDAAYFGELSRDVAKDMMEKPRVFYAIHDHPQLAPPIAGGVPLEAGGIGVAGAPDGDTDEECARAGVADITTRPAASRAP